MFLWCRPTASGGRDVPLISSYNFWSIKSTMALRWRLYLYMFREIWIILQIKEHLGSHYPSMANIWVCNNNSSLPSNKVHRPNSGSMLSTVYNALNHWNNIGSMSPVCWELPSHWQHHFNWIVCLIQPRKATVLICLKLHTHISQNSSPICQSFILNKRRITFCKKAILCSVSRNQRDTL